MKRLEITSSMTITSRNQANELNFIAQLDVFSIFKLKDFAHRKKTAHNHEQIINLIFFDELLCDWTIVEGQKIRQTLDKNIVRENA